MSLTLSYEDYFADAPSYRARASSFASFYTPRDPDDYFAPGLWIADEIYPVKVATPRAGYGGVTRALVPQTRLQEARQAFAFKDVEVSPGDAIINHFLGARSSVLAMSDEPEPIWGGATRFARPVRAGALIRFHIPRSSFEGEYEYEEGRYIRKPILIKFEQEGVGLSLPNGEIKPVPKGSEAVLDHGRLTTRPVALFQGAQRLIGGRTLEQYLETILESNGYGYCCDSIDMPSLRSRGTNSVDASIEETRKKIANARKGIVANPYVNVLEDFEYARGIMNGMGLTVPHRSAIAFKHHYSDVQRRFDHFEMHAPQF